jgi:hypothetical protein
MVSRFGHNQNTLQKCIIKESTCALFGPPYSTFTLYKIWGFTLDIVFAFAHYCFGNKFVFYVDYMALVYLIDNPQVLGKFAR